MRSQPYPCQTPQITNNLAEPKSKRVPTRLRNKIQKASANKQRKEKKLAKKNPEWRSKLKKDPGIPNLFPYKEKLLHKIEEDRLRRKEEQVRRREMAKAANTAQPDENADAERMDEDDVVEDFSGEEIDDVMDEDDSDIDESNPLAALIASARKAAEKYDKELESGSEMDLVPQGLRQSFQAGGRAGRRHPLRPGRTRSPRHTLARRRAGRHGGGRRRQAAHPGPQQGRPGPASRPARLAQPPARLLPDPPAARVEPGAQRPHLQPPRHHHTEHQRGALPRPASPASSTPCSPASATAAATRAPPAPRAPKPA